MKPEYTIHYPYGGGSVTSGAVSPTSPMGWVAAVENVRAYGDGKRGGLGLWLETDVVNDCVVVRRVQAKSYADVEEDVRPGDQVAPFTLGVPPQT